MRSGRIKRCRGASLFEQDRTGQDWTELGWGRGHQRGEREVRRRREGKGGKRVL